VKAFNDTVVQGGNVPLDVLARNVDEYLRTTTSESRARRQPFGSMNPHPSANAT
jgi:hypothetical protein